MPRVSRVCLHLSEAEVKEKIRTASNFRRQQKWLIIYNALVDPRTAAQIAQHTGTTVRTVHQVISDYNRLGPSAIETPGSGGRRRCYLSTSEEQQLLDELKPKAKRGEITTKDVLFNLTLCQHQDDEFIPTASLSRIRRVFHHLAAR